MVDRRRKKDTTPTPPYLLTLNTPLQHSSFVLYLLMIPSSRFNVTNSMDFHIVYCLGGNVVLREGVGGGLATMYKAYGVMLPMNVHVQNIDYVDKSVCV